MATTPSPAHLPGFLPSPAPPRPNGPMFWATNPIDAGAAGTFLSKLAERAPRLASASLHLRRGTLARDRAPRLATGPLSHSSLLPFSLAARRAHYAYTAGRSAHLFEDGTAFYVLGTRVAPWVLTGLPRVDGHRPIVGPAHAPAPVGGARTAPTDVPIFAQTRDEIAFHEAVLDQVEAEIAALDAAGPWSVASAPHHDGLRASWSAWRTCPPQDPAHMARFQAACDQIQRLVETLFSPLLAIEPRGFQGLMTGVAVDAGHPPFPGIPARSPDVRVTSQSGQGRMWHGDPAHVTRRLTALRDALQVPYGPSWDPALFLHYDPMGIDKHGPRPGVDPALALRKATGHVLSAPLSASTLAAASAHQKTDAFAWLAQAGVWDAASLL